MCLSICCLFVCLFPPSVFPTFDHIFLTHVVVCDFIVVVLLKQGLQPSWRRRISVIAIVCGSQSSSLFFFSFCCCGCCYEYNLRWHCFSVDSQTDLSFFFLFSEPLELFGVYFRVILVYICSAFYHFFFFCWMPAGSINYISKKSFSSL